MRVYDSNDFSVRLAVEYFRSNLTRGKEECSPFSDSEVAMRELSSCYYVSEWDLQSRRSESRGRNQGIKSLYEVLC
jgi:hypothetical protein